MMKSGNGSTLVSLFSLKEELYLKLILPTVPRKFSILRALPDRAIPPANSHHFPPGRQVLKNAPAVGIPKLWTSLADEGFSLKVTKEPYNRGDGIAIGMLFSRGVKSSEPVAVECLTALSELLTMAWQHGHAYDNSGVSGSVVVITPFDHEPASLIEAKNGKIVQISLPASVRVYTGEVKGNSRGSARN